MLCPHCNVHFHEELSTTSVNWKQTYSPFLVISTRCSGCEEYILFLKDSDNRSRQIEPLNSSRGGISSHVPDGIRADYSEACSVLTLSPKASAALSRRCLQNVLFAHGYAGRDLARQVDAVLAETDARKAIPIALYDTIDAIRNFGNFSAHPIDDQTTLQVIDVEPEEAEWCLEILEQMFEHFYEKPAIAAAKKASLNAKLTAAGKPLAK